MTTDVINYATRIDYVTPFHAKFRQDSPQPAHFPEVGAYADMTHTSRQHKGRGNNALLHFAKYKADPTISMTRTATTIGAGCADACALLCTYADDE